MEFQLTQPGGELKETWKRTLLLSFQSLGVIFGRMSIAPLFAFGTISQSDIESEEKMYELFSFVFWTLTIIPLLKYTVIVLRADDDGEGGVFALYSLLCRHVKVSLLPNDRSTFDLMGYEEQGQSKVRVESRARKAIEKRKISRYLILFLALFGASMTICDGVLTSSLSVLSATSGIGRSLVDISHNFSSSNTTRDHVDKVLSKYVPVTTACAILICVFTLQHCGSQKLGFLFAPIVIIWLLFTTGVGIYNIIYYDIRVIHAISPMYMLRFVRNLKSRSWGLLGSILLCIGGSEAMFADLGHFSKRSIKITFTCLIYPALLLCYAGQAAFISKHLGVSDNIVHFSESVPSKAVRHIFVVVSLFASAVGSQATVTASFSIISQCLALGCFPRVKVIHTSNKIHGQVYIPDANWILMLLTIIVTVAFRDMKLIGNATGLAIVSAMLVTTCLMFLIIGLCWEKSLFFSACFLVFFGSIEVIYLSGCFINFPAGTWYLLILVVVFMSVMLTWHYGTVKKYEFDLQNKVSLDWLTHLSPGLGVSRVPGIGFVYTDMVTGIPAFFSHFITNLPAFHQVLIFVTSKSLPIPHIAPSQRYLIGRVGPKEYRIYRCIMRYGYRDRVSDADDFEEHIIRFIGEFISHEETDSDPLSSPEGRMMVVTTQNENGAALVPLDESTSSGGGHEITVICSSSTTVSAPIRRKKVRFVLPPSSPRMRVSVREELQELVDARECGTAYFMGQCHLSARPRTKFLKKILIGAYVFLSKNSREPPVALNIPYAALLEVGMVYTI